jgi:histidinol-phosphatase
VTEEDLGPAHRLADIADGISGGYFAGGVVEAETKADGSPVTRVDREVEPALRDALARERPHEGFLGEEFGARGPAGRRWIVDAVDGTASFVAGEPEWSTLIALQARGEVFSDLSGGRSIEGTAGVFSNGALHDQVLEIVLEPG